METAYNVLFTGILCALGLLLFLCLIRSVIGPQVSDRIVAVNMAGTITIMIICVLALLLSEGYLVDIALLYAMLSFLAVVLLTKIYIGAHLQKINREGKDNA
jgi:multicomponent Na+:H+ antiporter subunit F